MNAHEHPQPQRLASDLPADTMKSEGQSACCGSASSAAVAVNDKPHTDPVCGMKAATNPEKSAVADDVTY
jgi:hypothetical protein